MEHDGSLPCSQEVASGPYPELHGSTTFQHIRFNIILPYTPSSSEWSLTFRFYNQNQNYLRWMLRHRPTHWWALNQVLLISWLCEVVLGQVTKLERVITASRIKRKPHPWKVSHLLLHHLCLTHTVPDCMRSLWPEPALNELFLSTEWPSLRQTV
jgi:hypothetical protein